jgi:hypothetical protein
VQATADRTTVAIPPVQVVRAELAIKAFLRDQPGGYVANNTAHNNIHTQRTELEMMPQYTLNMVALSTSGRTQETCYLDPIYRPRAKRTQPFPRPVPNIRLPR